MPEIILIPLLFVPAFAGLWLFLTWLLSRLSGWGRIANHYAGDFEGEVRREFRGASIRLSFVNYSFCIVFRTGPVGLGMGVLLPFRCEHPTIFVPWSEVTVAQEGRGLFSRPVLRFGRCADVGVRIGPALAGDLREAARQCGAAL